MKQNKCLYCCAPLTNESTMHEKCSLAFFGTPLPPAIPYALDQMHELAVKIVERRVAIPGVQPKLSLSLVRETMAKSDTRLTVVGALGGDFILKPPSAIFPEMPANEHVTMRMAEACGIRVVPSTLIQLASGELAYLSRRIDRMEVTGDHNANKIHMLDMFQITEAVDKYKSSMEKIGRAIDKYSDNTLLDKILFFEITLFCFLTGNNDMHLKNFSLIEGRSGWTLSPAYDLLNVSIANPADKEELALTLAGKKRKLLRKHFIQLAEQLGLTEKQTNGVFKRASQYRAIMIEILTHSFLSTEMQAAYLNLLEKRYNRLEL